MGTHATTVAVTAAVVACPAASALAASVGEAQDEPAASVAATGNPVTGGLGFSPQDVAVTVGQSVRWTNTDFFAPHTATEEHGLWDLAGSYGISALGPTGFGPGESVQRPFEAGTHAYYCRVHGRQAQHGTVAVPVTLRMIRQIVRQRVRVRRDGVVRRRTVRKTRYVVVATWSARGAGRSRLFDVEVRRGDGPWRPFMTGTTARDVRIPGGRAGTVTHVRARLRQAADPAQATGWSPDTAITSA